MFLVGTFQFGGIQKTEMLTSSLDLIQVRVV